MPQTRFYTIGYQGASLTNFISTLKAAGVALLIDVRHSPYSLRKEFCREELCEALEAEGIAYQHMPSLGNPPKGRAAARAGHTQSYRQIFAAHLRTLPAQKALERTGALAKQVCVCLMCLERSPMRCHRSIIAEDLIRRAGLEVVHLNVEEGKADPRQYQFGFL